MAAASLTATSHADFSLDRYESYNYVTFTTSSSTTDVAYGTTAPLAIELHYSNWEVWVDEYGNTETRNSITDVISTVSVNLTVDYGDGTLDNSTVSTNSNGQATANMTMGSQATRIRASYGDASATLDFSPPSTPTETFEYNRTESALVTTLSSPWGTTDVANGAERHLQLVTTFTTWEVWISNYGNTDLRNYTYGGTSGASVNLVIESGDGSIVSGSGYNDGAGNLSSVSFLMGTQNTRVRADVSYGGFNASSAVDFSLPSSETFAYSHIETTLTATASGNGPTSGLQPGGMTGVAVVGQYQAYEVWISNYGNTDHRNPSSGAAANVTANFNVTSGDSYLYSNNATTDYSGLAYVSMNMGSQNTTVEASVYFAGLAAYDTVTFTLAPVEETFTYDRTESSLSVSLSAPEGSIIPVGGSKSVVALAEFTTWEIWVGNMGSTQVRNQTTGPVPWSYANFSIDPYVFAASVSSSSYTTDGQGKAYATVWASEGVTVRVDVYYASPQGPTYNATATLGFGIDYGPPPELYSYHHSETSTSVGFSTPDPTTGLAPGTMRILGAYASVTTWEVWTSNYGNSDNRNYNTTPMESVSPSIDYGDGTFYGSGPSIFFTMGTQATRLSLSLNGQTAYLEFTPEIFTMDGYHTALAASLTAPEGTDYVPRNATRIVNLHVDATVSEKWVGDHGTIEYRNPVTNYAEGASVNFTVSGDATLSTSNGVTDAWGNLSIGLTMGDLQATLLAEVGSGPAATAVLTFTPEFTFDHSESAVLVGLSSPEGTSNVPQNAPRTIQLLAQYKTWDVYKNQQNVEEIRNEMIGPAGNAPITYTVSSDGTLSSPNGDTDSSGMATNSFIMGLQESTVTAEVTFNSITANASITFFPVVDDYEFVRTDTYLVTTIDPSGTNSGLIENDQRNVQVSVTLRSEDVYQHKMNPQDIQIRNQTNTAANNATVNFLFDAGDGSLSQSSTTTDSSGLAYTVFTMGLSNSTLHADVAFEVYTGSTPQVSFEY